VPETTFYVYDAGGQRARKVTERQNGSHKEERIYLGGFEIYREFNGNGIDIALERETLHIMDDRQRIALVETRTQGSPTQLIRYQFGNHLGSASLELDYKANVISYEEYFPYGSTSYQAMDKNIKAAAKRYQYTGKERDKETGFSYHGARYYAGWLGRWTSTDQRELVDGINLFAYSRNNPVRFADPTGEAAESKDSGFLSGLAGRLWDRANTPTEAQRAFKEGRYGDFAMHTAIDAALASNPVIAGTVSDYHLSRATIEIPGQLSDAVTAPRNDEAGAKMADALVTGTVLALRIVGPKAKGIVRAPARGCRSRIGAGSRGSSGTRGSSSRIRAGSRGSSGTRGSSSRTRASSRCPSVASGSTS
jgi:RHS repeat-associated protein